MTTATPEPNKTPKAVQAIIAIITLIGAIYLIVQGVKLISL